MTNPFVRKQITAQYKSVQSLFAYPCSAVSPNNALNPTIRTPSSSSFNINAFRANIFNYSLPSFHKGQTVQSVRAPHLANESGPQTRHVQQAVHYSSSVRLVILKGTPL